MNIRDAVYIEYYGSITGWHVCDTYPGQLGWKWKYFTEILKSRDRFHNLTGINYIISSIGIPR